MPKTPRHGVKKSRLPPPQNSEEEDYELLTDTESDASDEADFVQVFGNMTVTDIKSGTRTHAPDDLKLDVLIHAIGNGYSSALPPSLDIFLDLIDSQPIPSRDAIGLRSIDTLVNKIANLVRTHVSSKAWPGLMREDTSTRTLHVSSVLYDAVMSNPPPTSFDSLVKGKEGMLARHAKTEHSWKSYQQDDNVFSWRSIEKKAMSSLVIASSSSRSSLTPNRATSSNTTNRFTTSTTPNRVSFTPSRINPTRSSPAPPAAAIYSPPRPITAADLHSQNLRNFVKWQFFLIETSDRLALDPEEDSGAITDPEMRKICQEIVDWTSQFNKGSMVMQENVDYGKWVKKAINRKLIKGDDDGEGDDK